MKKIIKINECVFVRNKFNWKVYSTGNFYFMKDIFMEIGRIKMRNDKYCFYPRNDGIGIRLNSIGEETMETIISFVKNQNKKLKYLGE